jgi:hypothetical protein
LNIAKHTNMIQKTMQNLLINEAGQRLEGTFSGSQSGSQARKPPPLFSAETRAGCGVVFGVVFF